MGVACSFNRPGSTYVVLPSVALEESMFLFLGRLLSSGHCVRYFMVNAIGLWNCPNSEAHHRCCIWSHFCKHLDATSFLR
jgi:hypothetical protein